MSWQHILEHTIQLSDGHIIKYVNILGPVVGWFERSTCYEDVEESMRVGPRPTQSVSALQCKNHRQEIHPARTIVFTHSSKPLGMKSMSNSTVYL